MVSNCKKPYLLLVTPSFQTFIKQDIKILSEKFEIKIDNYPWRKKKYAPLFLILQFFHLLIFIPKSFAIIIQFGGYWSFFPSLLGKFFKKPVLIILHGTDCASIPELNYGSLRLPMLKWFCKKSYEWASLLVPVSQSLIYHHNNYFNYGRALTNGIKFHFPTLKTPFQVIPNGFDLNFWKPNKEIIKNGTVFTSVLSKEQFKLKGGDLILELAKIFPNFSFSIVGMEKPQNQNIPENLFFLGRLEPSQLRCIYQKSDFYLQLSIFEGFGCSLCEAMLCGCVPIGSCVNEIPNIIGDSGKIVFNRMVSSLEEEILRFTSNYKTLKTKERPEERIALLYNLENRKKLIYNALENPFKHDSDNL